MHLCLLNWDDRDLLPITESTSSSSCGWPSADQAKPNDLTTIIARSVDVVQLVECTRNPMTAVVGDNGLTCCPHEQYLQRYHDDPGLHALCRLMLQPRSCIDLRCIRTASSFLLLQRCALSVWVVTPFKITSVGFIQALHVLVRYNQVVPNVHSVSLKTR